MIIEVLEQMRERAKNEQEIKACNEAISALQGKKRSIHLPCEIGTVFYSIICEKEPYAMKIDSFIYDADGISPMVDGKIYKSSLFGKYYFYNKDEAMNAFKEFRRGKDVE